ncbi:fibrinogen-like protein 1 [Lingula anatina]|uniref:Fibrinogen-like protein 1 n=1 Tax=Lingula anatina TaxID=7574 RepID=A0A2R2MNA3_LINAN|nr:fibrinogen-like protein 1 [Lingula anatina]|eukprot:XP_023931537.1 fibrinogen-like protein 1 [Lingula anatina]
MSASSALIALVVFCLLTSTEGHLIQRRQVNQTETSPQQCAVSDRLLDMLQNVVQTQQQELKTLDNKYDDLLVTLESKYDDLLVKYTTLVETTAELQINVAKCTSEKQGADGKDCAELYKNGLKLSGVYTITPSNGQSPFDVYCDMTTDGGGWTVFQKRMDGSVDFYRGWEDYKHGFGNLNGEYWLGNDQINLLTHQGHYELRVDLEDATGVKVYARYDNFAVSSERTNYQLTLGAYSGDAGDSLAYHNGASFSTKDRDNDTYEKNCAQKFKGAWWYKACHNSNLNGLYHLGDHSSNADGVNWETFKGDHHSLKSTEMKVRPVGFKSTNIVIGRQVNQTETSPQQCAVTDRLLDMLQNVVRTQQQELKTLENKYDDLLVNLESKYDDLLVKYTTLVETTAEMQKNVAKFTSEGQGADGKDCAELYKNGLKLSGVYTITPSNGQSPFDVYCDMTTDGGGWTVFQKRMDGSVDFYRGWQDYKHGFGNLNGEYWLGNDQINLLTHQGHYELRVDLEDATGVKVYARYDNFAVSSERTNYQLTLGAYSGDAGLFIS